MKRPAPFRWHRTKIICTLGPATDPPEVLREMIRGGMDVARVNTAHGNFEEHSRRIRAVHSISRELGAVVGILVDLPGPKWRIGTLPKKTMELVPGRQLIFTTKATRPNEIPVGIPAILRKLRRGDLIYLADGLVKLQVKAVSQGRVRAEVITGGIIRSNCGINFPETDLAPVIPTPEDVIRIRWAVRQQADWIGVSFVRSAHDLKRVRAYLPKAKGPLLIAKIERRQAIPDLDEIIEASDGVMVARGDLGVETGLAEVPLLQKRIIALANAKARPIVTATQMLESMVNQRQPTRAEVTDVANAVLDGSDSVMLSAETAVGRYPLDAVKILDQVLLATETEYAARMSVEHLMDSQPGSFENPLSFVACRLALELNARAIVTPVADFATVLRIARFRPAAPILAMTSSRELAQQLALVWDVIPIPVAANASLKTCIRTARKWLFSRKLARVGDPMVAVSMSLRGDRKMEDTLQVIRLSRR